MENKKYSIVLLEGHTLNPGDLSWEGLEEFGNLTTYERTSPDEIVERSKDADMILINKSEITAEILDQLPKLKYIGELATGYNTIDLKAASERGIVVSNIPSYSTMSVVQMVFAQIFAITNHVERFANDNRNGRWSKSPDFCYWDDTMHEMAGKRIGIYGLGHIGMRVAQVALAFGMKVGACTSKEQGDLQPEIEKLSFDDLLAQSDIVSLHCPLTENTRGMINADSLAKMKRGSILINVSRGPLVVEQAVADALQSGQLSAYGADVMSAEPPKADNPLLGQPNAFVTPHVAWATIEARKRLLGIAIENIKCFVEGRPQNVVSE